MNAKVHIKIINCADFQRNAITAHPDIMNIFLRRIPANTKHIEITEFVSPVLKRGFFKKSGRILNVEILALQDMRVGTIEYHGLVTLDSEDAVESVVLGLKDRRLNGRMVLVRRYFHRSWYNDQRQKHSQVAEVLIEKRKGDRRRGRHLQVVKNASDCFNSEDDFVNTVTHQEQLIKFMLPKNLEADFIDSVTGFNPETQADNETNRARYRPIKFLTAENEELNSANFHIYAEQQHITALLNHLKGNFSDAGIQYWILPVVEKGKL
jgi:hypothetical protein